MVITVPEAAGDWARSATDAMTRKAPAMHRSAQSQYRRPFRLSAIDVLLECVMECVLFIFPILS